MSAGSPSGGSVNRRKVQLVLDVVNLAPAHVAAVAQRQADALQRPPCTVGALLDDLSRHGLPRAAAELRRYL
jgi:hypothetical protein